MELFEHKYKPKSINDLLIDNEIIELLDFLIHVRELNILLYGEPHSGKTCIIRTIIRELKQRGLLKDKNIFDLNNLNDQTFVQNMNDLKIFCNSAIVENDLFIVVIDNIEDFNENNQQNLKQLVENSKHNINFLCSINNINDLIEPLQSQLLQICCKGLNHNKIYNILKNINNLEVLNLNDNEILSIMEHSQNDFNIILKYIEKIYLLGEKSELNESFFTNIEKKHYINFINACKNNNSEEANNILLNLSKKGFFFLDILEEFYQYIKMSNIEYDFLHLICKYTDLFYDGYDNDIQFYFFTHDSIRLLKT